MMADDRDTLAEDWVALWQSEMTAMAADRELREYWIGFLALWASLTNVALQLGHVWRGYDQPWGPAAQSANGVASTNEPPGTAPIVTASDIGSDEAKRLYERIGELESRLSAFERKEHKPARSGSP
jgi:hypothetical protein